MLSAIIWIAKFVISFIALVIIDKGLKKISTRRANRKHKNSIVTV